MLSRFKLQAEKLEKYPEALENIKLKFHMTPQKSLGMPSQNLVDDKILAPFMNAFRPFFIKRGRNSLNFKDVTELLLADPRFEGYQADIHNHREAWINLTETDHNSGMVIKVGDNEWPTITVFNTWMNEGYFHQEQYHKGSGKGVDVLKQHPLIELSSRFVFVDLLQRLTRLVVSLNQRVVRDILEHHEITL